MSRSESEESGCQTPTDSRGDDGESVEDDTSCFHCILESDRVNLREEEKEKEKRKISKISQLCNNSEMSL